MTMNSQTHFLSNQRDMRWRGDGWLSLTPLRQRSWIDVCVWYMCGIVCIVSFCLWITGLNRPVGLALKSHLTLDIYFIPLPLARKEGLYFDWMTNLTNNTMLITLCSAIKHAFMLLLFMLFFTILYFLRIMT